jgi:Domain of unknown function (DUF397)
VNAPGWRTSSHSIGNGQRVECRARGWRKPKRSAGNGACFEVRSEPGAVDVRDSKLADRSPVLTFSPEAWGVFTSSLRSA